MCSNRFIRAIVTGTALGVFLLAAIPPAHAGPADVWLSLLAKLDAQDKATVLRIRDYMKNTRKPKDCDVVPPDIPLACPKEGGDAAQDSAISQFILAVSDPEEAMWVSLLDILKRRSERSADSKSEGRRPVNAGTPQPAPTAPAPAPDAAGALTPNEQTILFDDVKALMLRVRSKASALMRKYKGQPDKYIAVTRLAMQIEKSSALVDSDPDDPGDTRKAFMESIGWFAYSCVDPLLKRIREQHEYQLVHWVMEMRREAELVGYVPSEGLDTLFAKIDKAMRFKINLVETDTWAGWYDFVLKSELFVSSQLSAGVTKLQLVGSGTSDYESTDFRGSAPQMSNTASTFQAAITDFNPCEGTATVGLDKFFSAQEQFYWLKTRRKQVGNQKGIWYAYFGDHEDPKYGGFTFAIDAGSFHNKSEVVIEKTFERRYANPGGEPDSVVTLLIRVTHAPQ